MANPRNLLLDTHVLLWWLDGSNRLPRAARDAIGASQGVYVSAATAWEIGIKAAQGKLEFGGRLDEQLLRNDFRALPVSIAHALAASALPFHHHDPFDRMLIAQAQMESLMLVTNDARLKSYDATVLVV
jgi:PIN domain nuclease of toxin-antitoxin system